MIFVGLRARNQLILVKIIDFRPLVPQKLSVESSINDDVHQKRVSSLRKLQNQQKCLAVRENILNKYYMHLTLLIYCLFLLLSRNCITKLKIRSNSKSLFRNKRFVLDVMFHKNDFNFALCLEY